MKKTISKKLQPIVATALTLTLAVPAVPFVKGQAADAAQTAETTRSTCVLGQALVTYDFEQGEESLNLEGEEKLYLANGVPVIENGEYKKVTSDALPEVTSDDKKGMVLRFKDSESVQKFVKTQSDELDEEYPVGSYLQLEKKAGGRVHLENPYKGMEFNDTDGVTISYWVKVPTVLCEEDPEVNNKGGSYVGANSTTVVFNNESKYAIQRDDYLKHLACLAYDKFQENILLDEIELIEGVPETRVNREDFNQGTQEIVSADGNTYILYSDYGKLVRLSPDYPKTEVDGVKPTVGGGWYAPSDEHSGYVNITAVKEDGTTVGIAPIATNTTAGTGQYAFFRYLYAPNEAAGQSAELVEAEEKKLNEQGYSSKSRVRDGYIMGSMQISTDNDFGFCEDNYITESAEIGLGPVIAGCKVTNPNSSNYGNYQDFHADNKFCFDGDEFVTQGKEEDEVYYEEEGGYVVRPAIEGADTWHYVTIVIENDWVQTYVDGVAADVDAGDYQYLKDLKMVPSHNFAGKDVNNGKEFNKGYGIRGIYRMQNNIAGWGSYGTLSSVPGNSAATTMLEWLADENTELYLGGTGLCSEMLYQGYGTVEGVCLDDVSFWDKALDKQEAVQLYNEVKEDMRTVLIGDANGDGKISLDDVVSIMRYWVGLEEIAPEYFINADLSGDGRINSDDAVILMKVMAGLDLDWVNVDKSAIEFSEGVVPKPTVSLKAGEADGECICSVSVDNADMQKLDYGVLYDETKLKVKDIRNTGNWWNYGIGVFDSTQAGKVTFVGVGYREPQVYSGELFTVTFEILDESMDEAEVTVITNAEQGILEDGSNAVMASGSIKPLIGDVSGDQKISLDDAVLIFKHYVGSEEIPTTRYKRADVNGDGKIDLNDAMEILNAMAGLDTHTQIDTSAIEFPVGVPMPTVSLEAGKAGSGECICKVYVDNAGIQKLDYGVLFDETRLRVKNIQESYNSATAGQGMAAINSDENGKVAFMGVAMQPSLQLGNALVLTVTFEVLDESMDKAEVTVITNSAYGMLEDGSNAVKATADLKPGNKEVVTNPDGSVSEKVTETATATDGAVTEKVTETTTDRDGNVTSETVTETTTNPDGSLEKEIQTLKKQLDEILKVVEQLKQLAEDIYNRYVVTEKTSLTDGTTTVKEVSESAVKDELGNIVKNTEVVDTKKNADGVSTEKYEYTTQTLPEDVEWSTIRVPELSQEEKSNLDRRGAGTNMEAYDINPYSNGEKVEPKEGSVRVSLNLGNGNWDRNKVKVFDFKNDIWLDAHFEGDFIVFEAQHFSQYAVVQLDNVKKGDADLSGDITLADAQTALRAALHIRDLDGPDKTAADVDGDNNVSLADAEKILKAAMHVPGEEIK